MILVVESRWTIGMFEGDVPYIIISITENSEEFAKIPKRKNCKGILQLKFSDVEEDIGQDIIDKYKLTLFNENHARQILNFVFENENDVKMIVCQCDAGISRSSATAKALDKILNSNAKTEYHFCLLDSKFDILPFFPNNLVYRTLIREYVKILEEKNNQQSE
jgi:predicted protein tyrosine phosphatase